jgi:hypothetical protein
MEHYVTLFNSLFLPQGLALHASMERHVCRYVLWILCVDNKTHDVLTRLTLPNVRLLKLYELETAELLTVKPTRTIAEYCWTLTPFAPRFVFDQDASVNRVTYLDADVWFMKHPKPIFDEFDNSLKHVMLTEHAFAPEYDQSAKSGHFCVQFMPFTRNGSEPVRKWWEERCIEWCFNRFEDNKFGDQKYLDDWPERFSSLIHVLQDRHLALAPWNSSRFNCSEANFYHFHGLRILNDKVLKVGEYHLPRIVLETVYHPYACDLRNAVTKLQLVNYKIHSQVDSRGYLRALQKRIRQILRVITHHPRSEYMKF